MTATVARRRGERGRGIERGRRCREMRTLLSTAGRPTAGRSPSRLNAWGVVLCLTLVSGLLFLPTMSAVAATPSADLSVSGSVSPDPGTGGGTLTFAFTVHNEGPDPAEGTTLVGHLSPGLTPTSMSANPGTCSIADSTVTCDLGIIKPGPADVSVTFVVLREGCRRGDALRR